MAISTDVDDKLPNSSSPFLPSQCQSQSPLSSKLVSSLVAVSICAAIVSVFFFYSTSCSLPDSLPEVSRPLSKLKRPVVLMISCDGFRFGYQHKTAAPNIHRLIQNGTEAELGLIPVFPTATFPNHYSIVTGLHPPYHGIIYNYFTDPTTGKSFTTRSHEPEWWLGEPIWETVVNHGLKASAYFWAGSEVHKGAWDCPKDFCMKYNSSVPFDDRVDTVLSYFGLPSDEIPSFMALYFEDPDSQGHKVGPDDPQITAAVANVDRVIGRLISGLEELGIFEDVTVILVGDHGMVTNCDQKLIILDDLSKWIEIPEEWVQFYSPVFGLSPPPGQSLRDIVDKINEGLESGSVENGEYFRVFLKEELPSRLHYSDSVRIPPIIGLLDEGYKLEHKRSNKAECGGSHGYDNAFASMRSIFIAHGPQFSRGRKVPSFKNVEIYNLVTAILNIEGAPNNGTESFARSILLP